LTYVCGDLFNRDIIYRRYVLKATESVEKINVDDLESSDAVIDEESLKSYEESSNDVKTTVAKETGVKITKDDDTVLLKDNGVDDDGNMKVEIKRGKAGTKPIKDFLGDHGTATFLGVLFSIVIILNCHSVFKFYLALKTLDLSYTFFNNIAYELFLALSPMVIWFYSTNHTVYNFRVRKRMMFSCAYFSFNFMFIRLVYIFAYLISTPFISRIPIVGDMTAGKIVGMIYIATLIPVFIIVGLLILLAIRHTVFNKDFLLRIDEFRLFKVLDYEHFSKYEYVDRTVRNIENGKYITIPQKDRQMHKSIIGATGTAKTSSVLLPGILSDLKVRILNKKQMKKLLWKYTKKGLLIIKEPFEDIDFSPDKFEPNPDYKPSFFQRIIGRTPEKIFNYIVEKYEIAGQTILAPEDSLTDDAYDLIEAYGEKCNRVDPVLVDGKHKPGFKGMNILYISPSMPDWKVDREKVRRATLLSDVMQIMFEMGGKSDPYFASVNRIATTTVALLLQLTYPGMKGRQPNLIDVRDCLNDFRTLRGPFDFLFPDATLNSSNEKWRWLKDNLMNFFLGEGAETFEQHARGLKVQFSSFLADDYIKNLVSADEVIDFDEILSKNELTVVNIELPEIGPINSPALGLFFTVNMSNAILRRPGNENTRTFHIWRIDEFPIVVTPSMEQAFTLFRKFKVAMEVALQTLDQMEKTPFLRYLKGVILNSTANQIVFGRANFGEMSLYSKMSGTREDVVDMEGISETSLFAENPTLSMTKRKTKSIANVVEESDVRFKDFQEVMFIRTKRGSLMPTIHGKVEFLKRKDKRGPRKIKRRNWNKLYNETSIDKINEVVDKRQTLAVSNEELEKLKELEKESGTLILETVKCDESQLILESQISSDSEKNVSKHEEKNQEAKQDSKREKDFVEEINDLILEIEDEIIVENEIVEDNSHLTSTFEEETIKVDPIEAEYAAKNPVVTPVNSLEARKMKKTDYDSFIDN